ncbi:MAG: hypothetical protein MJZ38_03220 [archaeon]|nr:hypothetical protein [archaeon]
MAGRTVNQVRNGRIFAIVAVLTMVLCSLSAFDADRSSALTKEVSNLADLQSALASPYYDEIIVTQSITRTDGTVLDGDLDGDGIRKTVRARITGTEDDGTINDGQNGRPTASNYTIFKTATGSTVNIDNLIIKGGGTTAVINNSKLTMDNSVISNSGSKTNAGGGIRNMAGCTLVMKDSSITRNIANYGGGFQNQNGILILDHCSVTENRSYDYGGGGGENTGTATSAGMVDTTTYMYVYNSTIAFNISQEIGGGINNCKGAHLYIVNSTVAGNATNSMKASDATGGGIGNNNSSVTCYNSIIAYNYQWVNGQFVGNDVSFYSNGGNVTVEGCVLGNDVSKRGSATPPTYSSTGSYIAQPGDVIFSGTTEAGDLTGDRDATFTRPSLVVDENGNLVVVIPEDSVAYPSNNEGINTTPILFDYEDTNNIILEHGEESVPHGGEIPEKAGSSNEIEDDEKVISITVLQNPDFQISGGSVFTDSYVIQTSEGHDLVMTAVTVNGRESVSAVWCEKLANGRYQPIHVGNTLSVNVDRDMTLIPLSFEANATGTDGAITVSWEVFVKNPNGTKATIDLALDGCEIKYSDVNDIEAAGAERTIMVGGGQTSAVITGLENGTPYYVWVTPTIKGEVGSAALVVCTPQEGSKLANNNLPQVTVTAQQTMYQNDGLISGVKTTMEYKSDGAWTKITSTSDLRLAPGTYYVRFSETKSYYASNPVTCVILEKNIEDITVISSPTKMEYWTKDVPSMDLAGLRFSVLFTTGAVKEYTYSQFTSATAEWVSATGYGRADLTLNGRSLLTSSNLKLTVADDGMPIVTVLSASDGGVSFILPTADHVIVHKSPLGLPTATPVTYNGSVQQVTINDNVLKKFIDEGLVIKTTRGEGIVSSARDAGEYVVATYAIAASRVNDFEFSDENRSVFYSLVWTVGKAPLQVTPANSNTTYGSDVPAYTFNVSGLLGGDTKDVVLGDASYVCAYVKGSSVGSYTIAISSTKSTLHADNYILSFGTGTVTVGKAQLTITVGDASGPNQSDAKSRVTYTVDGLLCGDQVTDVLGTVSITTPTTSSFSVSFSKTPVNYKVTVIPGKYTYSKWQVTLTVDHGDSRYGDSPANYVVTATCSYGKISPSIISGWTFQTTYLNTTTGATSSELTSTSDAGSYKLTISFAGKGDYGAGTATCTFTIFKRDVTLVCTADDISYLEDVTYVASLSSEGTTICGPASTTGTTIRFDGSFGTVTITPNSTNPFYAKGKDCGTYRFIAKFTSVNYTATEVWGSFKVLQIAVTEPTASMMPIYYSGEAKNVAGYITNFDNTYMTIRDNIQTDVGDYTATVTLRDTKNYKWAAHTGTSLTFPWRILPLNVLVIAGSANVDGDENTVLTCQDYTVIGLPATLKDNLHVNVSGSQRGLGWSANTVDAEFVGVSPSNFVIVEVDGLLTVHRSGYSSVVIGSEPIVLSLAMVQSQTDLDRDMQTTRD